MAVTKTLKTYYWLTKPGIIYGNGLTAIAGFLLASHGHVVLSRFAAMLVGTSLVIAGACVFNNYIDRGIDAKMKRTKRRALVTGKISAVTALSYATVLTVIGLTVLVKGTNALTVTVGVVAFIDYVVLYGLAKRHTVHSTLVGTIAGAAPIVAGYVAASNHLDAGAWLLCLILVCWQMAHFYAIGIYRLNDYREAGLPILPVKSGVEATIPQIVAYMVGLVVAVSCLYAAGYIHLFAVLVLLGTAAGWLRLGTAGFMTNDAAKWARQVFLYSLVFILLLSLTLSLNHWL